MPRAEDFEARLSDREANVRAGLAELEAQLETLETLVVSGSVVARERAALREAFETLRRELDCIVGARRAVATLRPGASNLDLPARRAAQAAVPALASSAPLERRKPGPSS